MIFLLVLLNASDYSGGPLNYQVLQAIPLVQISVHELLHSLPWKPTLLALLVKLCLLLVDVIDQVSQLP